MPITHFLNGTASFGLLSALGLAVLVSKQICNTEQHVVYFLRNFAPSPPPPLPAPLPMLLYFRHELNNVSQGFFAFANNFVQDCRPAKSLDKKC